jgi:hypothetical protein
MYTFPFLNHDFGWSVFMQKLNSFGDGSVVVIGTVNVCYTACN